MLSEDELRTLLPSLPSKPLSSVLYRAGLLKALLGSSQETDFWPSSDFYTDLDHQSTGVDI
jgi:hypothetical protein